MNNLKNQFYNEGLATTFYQKPIKYVSKHIKNKKMVKFLSFIIKVLYTIIVLLVALFIFYKKVV